MIFGKTIRGVLSYNENKVAGGKAECLLASGFAAQPNDLTFHQKFKRFTSLMLRNEKVKTNTLHISLNFDTTENIAKDLLKTIATTYMQKIGFGSQPFLVYEHHDAAHPHLHIVTTNVQANGRRIDLHNIGRNQSETARKEIEIQFGLVKAESKKRDVKIDLPAKAIYGKSETRRSIVNVVQFVTTRYRFTSVPELNAALRQFNVIADRGSEESRMYKKQGLVYSMLDEKGQRIGISVKASSIHGKPTIKFLEKQFKLNEALRTPKKEKLRSMIDRVLNNPRQTKITFRKSLSQLGIDVVLRQNDRGLVYGITFVDNVSKTVFNGSDLGKPYAAKAIMDLLDGHEKAMIGSGSAGSGTNNDDALATEVANVITDLMTAQQYDFTSPNAALRPQRKKRKKGRSI